MHIPVMVEETLDLLAIRAGGRYVDATVGCGGHAEAIASRLGPDGRLLGVDRDPFALEQASARLAKFGDRCVLRHGRFSELRTLAADAGMDEVDGVLMDVGMSSLQVDRPERGFSFLADGPLDMRMDPGQRETAADLVRDLSETELAALIRTWGEDPRARRIAARMVRERNRAPLRTTTQLAAVVASATGGVRGRTHPATRTFQALRMAVNREEAELREGLNAALAVLGPGGRLAVISFHSIEDRMVKQAFRAHVPRDVGLAAGGVERVGREPPVRILTPRPVRPGLEEQRTNPRARSARLRAAERKV